VPDDGSAELKHVAPISVVSGCILHLYCSIVQHNGMNQNKNVTLFAAVHFEAFYQVPELKSSN